MAPFAAASLPLGEPRALLPLPPPLPLPLLLLAAAELLLLLPPVEVVVDVFTVVALTVTPGGEEEGEEGEDEGTLPAGAPELAPRCKKLANKFTARLVRGWWSPSVKRNSCTAITTTVSASAPFSLLLLSLLPLPL
jgi:hypothetical protein